VSRYNERTFVRALGRSPRGRSTADPDAVSRLNMAEYRVLVLFSEQPDHAIRMNELAAQAILTPSAVTRVIER
jgi:DNA-binding MarR family transcriptional regulator